MVAVGPNFFYTVTLPVTLWFLDKGKRETDRADKVLFIDARHIFRQIDRAHRDLLPEQIEFLPTSSASIAVSPLKRTGSSALMDETFPEGHYADVPACAAAVTLDEIERQGWSLTRADTWGPQQLTMKGLITGHVLKS